MVVRLKDIAAQAGVSTTTVSRILNGRDTGIPIREETRQKVIALAAEMGYRPNIMARALRGSHSTLLGVIAVNITSLFHTQILRGINDTAVRRNYRVFLGHVQRDADIALDYGTMFEQSHADGILIVGELLGHAEAVDVLAQIIIIWSASATASVPALIPASTSTTCWGRGWRWITCGRWDIAGSCA